MQQRHVRRRRGAVAVVLALALLALVVAWPNRRPIIAWATHWKGSPSHTMAWAPYPSPPAFHLGVAGDVGESGARSRATAAAMGRIGDEARYDTLLLLGDNVYPAGDPSRLEETVFGPYRAVLDEGASLLAVLGNHDVGADGGAAQLQALGIDAAWWARTYGDVLLVGLDSNRPDDPDQLRWLQATLSTSTARWKVVALHHPPYSAGYHGSDHAARAAFSPLFVRYGVQLVLSGHEHDYQRSKPIDGVTYVVTGAASTTRRTGTASFTAVSFSWHSFVDLAEVDGRLVVRAVNESGRVADEAVLLPAPASAP